MLSEYLLFRDGLKLGSLTSLSGLRHCLTTASYCSLLYQLDWGCLKSMATCLFLKSYGMRLICCLQNKWCHLETYNVHLSVQWVCSGQRGAFRSTSSIWPAFISCPDYSCLFLLCPWRSRRQSLGSEKTDSTDMLCLLAQIWLGTR